MNRALFVITVLVLLVTFDAGATAAEESALAKRLYGEWTRDDGRTFYFSPTTYFRVADSKCYMVPLRIIDESSVFSALVVRLDPERGDNAVDWKIELSRGENRAMVSSRSRQAARVGAVYVPDYKKADEMPLTEIPFIKPPTPYRKVSDARAPGHVKCERSL